MKKCAFLTMDSLDGFCCYDHLLHEPMKESGWDVEEISWCSNGVSWDAYEVVLIRSPWDYMEAPKQFLKVLEEIDGSKARLENSLNIVKWNIEKTYLRDLEQRGVPSIPTLWNDRFVEAEARSFFDQLNVGEIIIKPTLGAGAQNTYRLGVEKFEDSLSILRSDYVDRAFMVQPFISEIIDPGEFSLFYFAGELSHAIQKKPKAGDFRVQEEHGGVLSKIEPDADMLSCASCALELIGEMPLYARVDLVPYRGQLVLMEIELIEPSLYFNLDAEAPGRFVKAFDRWMSEKS